MNTQIKEQQMATNTKNYNKRMTGTTKYIDDLQEQNSKLLVVRVDLGYKKPHSDDMTLEETNNDLNRMFNNMRTKLSIFKDKVGYVCKKEYTEDRGVHMHTLFIYDGQQIQKGAFKADQIGEYWQQITEGKGSYHNCHRNEYARDGIGILDHRDSDKRKVLDEDVISYLCKDDQDIAPLKKNKNDRAFTRGTLPKKKGKTGRPRSESTQTLD